MFLLLEWHTQKQSKINKQNIDYKNVRLGEKIQSPCSPPGGCVQVQHLNLKHCLHNTHI